MSIFTKSSASDASENRREVRQALPANAPRPITASAVRINLKEKKEVEAVAVRRATDTWQDEAWSYYDYIPEVSSSANLVAGILSRINIYGAYITKSSATPSVIESVKDKVGEEVVQFVDDIIYLLESGKGGTSGLLRTAALNLFIAGECYLVREPARFSNGMQERYQIRSVNEVVRVVKQRKATLALRSRRDTKDEDTIDLPADGYITRIWKSHPQFSDEADASLRQLLETCDSLLLMERAANARAKQMLPAGMLFIPDGISNGYQSDGEMEPEVLEDLEDDVAPLSDDESESFEETLQRYLSSPLTDEASGGIVGPLVIRGAPELGEKIKYIDLSRQFDPNHNNLMQAKLDRILSGLDIPKDVAAGFASVKYSNAILIEEQLFKAHIEPMILMIVDCLTTAFLRPALLAQGVDPKIVERCCVWYDPSAITAKPSRAEAATTGYGLGAISLDSWRRANGFSDSDAPSELERLQRFGMEKGMLNEATTEMVVNTLIPEEMQEKLRQSQLANSDPNAVQALDQALGGTDMEPLPAPTPASPDAPTEAPPTLLEP